MAIFSLRTIKAGVHLLRCFRGQENVNFAQAHLLKTQSFLFLVLEHFFRFGVEENSIPKRNKLFYSIIGQWTCWMQQIIKQNKVCEASLWKMKCRLTMCLKKDSWSKSFSSLTKTWNSPFEYLSIKICHIHNLFLLILFFYLKFKRSNSQSIIFLPEIFGVAFKFTRSFLTKLNFSCSSKV